MIRDAIFSLIMLLFACIHKLLEIGQHNDIFCEMKGDKIMKTGKRISIGITALMIALSFYLEGQEKIYSENIKSGTHLMAIVIDDLGNNMEGTEAILKLDIPITVAVMPFLPSSTQDAEAAYKAGHEVIVHMPMEPNKGLRKWLGPGAITADLTDEEIRQKVEQAIDNVPHAVGMNNHMGSKITTNERIMRIVLQVCKERNLYYLDSKTAYKSVIPKVAAELGVPYAENQMFLDDVASAEHVHKQMQLAYARMESQQITVMIGHVGASGKYTSSEILRAIPQFAQRGQLVRVSELILHSLIDPEIL